MATSSNSNGTGSIISASSLQHSEEYKYIIKQLHILNGRIQEQTDLTMTLLNRCKGEEKLEKEPEMEDNFDELPIKNTDDLQRVDDKIKAPKIRDMLIKKFVRVGGDNSKDLIRRVMPRLIDDKVLQEYIWVGGKGKKKFSLLNLPDVIKVCAR